MSDYITNGTELQSVANAIRTKGGSTALLVYPNGFVNAINAIEVGVDTSDANATASDMLSGKTAYVDGQKITGNIQSKSSSNLTASGATVTAPAGYYSTAATKTIDSGSTTQNAPTINSSTGLVTATATVTAGYQAADTKSNTLQLTTQAAQTITPGTTAQTIAAGKYLTGAQTIAGDANLVSGNIASGVSIFGVTGSHSGGTDTSDANATASDMLSGKTAYVDGQKITGNISTKTAQTYTPGTTNQTIASMQYLSGAQTILGDANLIPANIADGVSIFGVTGTHSGGQSGGQIFIHDEVDLVSNDLTFTVNKSLVDNQNYIVYMWFRLLYISGRINGTSVQRSFENVTLPVLITPDRIYSEVSYERLVGTDEFNMICDGVITPNPYCMEVELFYIDSEDSSTITYMINSPSFALCSYDISENFFKINDFGVPTIYDHDDSGNFNCVLCFMPISSIPT